jgi:hypothetical protein
VQATTTTLGRSTGIHVECRTHNNVSEKRDRVDSHVKLALRWLLWTPRILLGVSQNFAGGRRLVDGSETPASRRVCDAGYPTAGRLRPLREHFQRRSRIWWVAYAAWCQVYRWWSPRVWIA